MTDKEKRIFIAVKDKVDDAWNTLDDKMDYIYDRANSAGESAIKNANGFNDAFYKNFPTSGCVDIKEAWKLFQEYAHLQLLLDDVIDILLEINEDDKKSEIDDSEDEYI